MGSIFLPLQGLLASPNIISILLERQNLGELANASTQGFPSSPMKHLSTYHWKQMIDKQKYLGHMSESLHSFLGKMMVAWARELPEKHTT